MGRKAKKHMTHLKEEITLLFKQGA